MLAASRSTRRTALTLASTSITSALLIWQPQFEFYRGLSGLDCALVGLLAASLFRHGQPLATGGGVLVLTGFAAKCVFELVTAQTVFATGDGYAPVPLAHLIGLAAGIVASLARRGDVTHSSRICHQTVADAH